MRKSPSFGLAALMLGLWGRLPAWAAAPESAAPSASTRSSRRPQTIRFESVSHKFYLDGDFDLHATASSGLPVSFGASGDCSLSGETVHILGAGKCFLVARQGGDETFEPAPDVERRVVIEKASQRITFPEVPAKTYLDPDVHLEARTSSGLPIVFVEDGPCAVVDDWVRILGAGRCWLSAHQPGDPNFTAAPIVDVDFWIAKADQSLEFPWIADHILGEAPFPLRASASSRLPVAYATSGPCLAVDGYLHMADGGFCTVIAQQPGDANFNPSAAQSRTFAIIKVTQ